MEILDERTDVANINSVGRGEAFMWKGQLCIKTEIENQAVRLENTVVLNCFKLDDEITPVQIEITILCNRT